MKFVNRWVLAGFTIFASTTGIYAQQQLPNDQIRLELPAAQTISPYKAISGGGFETKRMDESPDPLISYRWEQEGEDLQVYYLKPLSVSTDDKESFLSIGSLESRKPKIQIRGSGAIQFDFGVESAAWLEFDSPDFNGEVTMSVSEYNKPAIVNAGPQSPVKTAKPVKYGNTYRLELNKELYEGVRFGWIHVHNLDKPWHITDVRLVCQAKPVNYKASFHTDRKFLDRIWYTGVYGVRLNLLKDYIGAILMDRGDRHSWTGDAYISQAVSMLAFGNYDMVRTNLDRTADDSNAIESYSLLWILGLLDYYMYSGDEEFFRAHFETINRKLTQARKVIENQLDLGFYGWDERLGAGFEHPNVMENRVAFQLLFVQTCRELTGIMTLAHEKEKANAYQQQADDAIEVIRKDSDWYKKLGIHAAADAVNGNWLKAAEKSWLRSAHFQNASQSTSFSPFNQFFIIKAMAKLDLHQKALETIDRVWGGQIRLGATSFWECFRPEWELFLNPNDPVPNGQHGYTSLCHPWSSGVSRWLSEEMLGIIPTLPGFKTYELKPHLTADLTSVEGEVPTPSGPIRFQLDAEKGKGSLQSPQGSRGAVYISKLGRTIKAILLNGERVTFSEDNEFAIIGDLAGGNYDIDLIFEGEISPQHSNVKAASYPVELVAVDTVTTFDNWTSKYGKKGYLILTDANQAKDKTNLPDFINDITWKTDGLGSPRFEKKETASGSQLGMLATQNPSPCQQTFALDILSDPERTYRFTIGTGQLAAGDKFLVEVFDEISKELIHPGVLVEGSGSVKFYTFEAKKPVRVRVSHMEGENPGISGIFF